jgi:hypothetical protein
MPSLLLSSQKGAEGARGSRAPKNALSRTRYPAGEQSSKSLRAYTVTVRKALERLNLSTAERKAWESVKTHLNEHDQGNKRRVNANASATANAPDTYRI